MKKPTRKMMAARRKIGRFADGGQLSSHSLGDAIMGGAKMALGAYSVYNQAAAAAKGTPSAPPPPSPAPSDTSSQPSTTPRSNALSMDADKSNYRGGGRIRKVAGKPIGKEDGLIAAQRGEYVVKKSAVKKLGTKALNTINKGKLPTQGRKK